MNTWGAVTVFWVGATYGVFITWEPGEAFRWGTPFIAAFMAGVWWFTSRYTLQKKQSGEPK